MALGNWKETPDRESLHPPLLLGPHPLTLPGPRAPWCFAAGTAGGVAARLAQCPTEMFIHHRADIPLEIGEEDAAGVDVLCLWWALFLWAAFFLFYTGWSLTGK